MILVVHKLLLVIPPVVATDKEAENTRIAGGGYS
jgi:hypothetical protein